MTCQHSKSKQVPELGVTALAGIGVFSNFMLLSSCDLLRYEDKGSIGLRSYSDEATGECRAFVTLDDQYLRVAQSTSIAALALGIAFLVASTVHTFDPKVPRSGLYQGVTVGLLELCLLEVYTAQNNGICDIEGCLWGYASIWLVMTQIAFVSALVGSWYSS